MSRTGQISVDTKDILPIIKKWLYSEHDIFMRELVSNANDAISKRHILGRNQNVELPEGKVDVLIDKKANTLTIKDNGIGLTEEEVEKYIAKLAFSGAVDFVEKLKEAGVDSKEDIIGKFGLGFYSAFMVADKVEVNTLSHTDGATAVRWVCEGDTEYKFEDSTKTEVGTEIILHINEDSKEFLELYKTRQVLTNYCQFMPYSIELADLHAEVKEGEEKKTDIINDTEPLWKKDPSSLKDEDYKNFYRKLFPMDDEPLFWLHLNVDHPFMLQGILFFPKLNPNKPLNDNSIKLFSKQVFVSDNVKNIIPEFLSMLKGTIDSSDIPLNVSRSALQGDPNIKKISNYIVKKVAESLKKLFKNDRERFETVWEDISVFVKYGCMTEPKFDEIMRPFVVYKNHDQKLMTFEEYKKALPEAHAEKLKDKVIYFEQLKSDKNLMEQFAEEKIPVVETESYIDPHFMQYVETTKNEKIGDTRFTSIDSIYEEIFHTEESDENAEEIKIFFKEVFGIKETTEEEKTTGPSDFDIEVKTFKTETTPGYLKVDEAMKRFAQMTKQMGNQAMAFPIKKTLVVNPKNALVKNALKIWNKGENKPLAEKICFHVQDLATISGEGLKTEDKEAFVKRSQDLISELSNLAL